MTGTMSRIYPFGTLLLLDSDTTDRHKPAIIIANHQSMGDIPFILNCPYEMRMVVKRWVWRMPVLGQMIRWRR